FIITGSVCNANEEAQWLIDLIDKYEIFGTGRPLPATEETIKAYCDNVLKEAESNHQFANDLHVGLKNAASLKPAVREIIIAASRPDFYNRFLLLCKIDVAKAKKIIKRVNARMQETKQIKWDAIGHMLEALEPNSNMTLSHILCIARTYVTITALIHEDKDDVREYVRNRLEYFQNDIKKVEEITKVRADWDCELHEYKKPTIPYKSVSYVLIKVLDKLIP
ncbi:unnamed protein product, partial [Medioppia subpectinata]